MNAKTLYVLVALAVIAVFAAVAVVTSRAPRGEAERASQPLVAALQGHVNDVSGITVTGAGNTVIATLTRGKDGWTIAERGGYPADISRVRELLVKLDRATLLEQKTANPKRYADIGVDDVADKNAKGVRVEILGLPSPARLIVGSYAASSGGTFVRREGEAQSWLASGNLGVPKTVNEWEKRDVVDIPAARLAAIQLTAHDGRKLDLRKAHRDDASYEIAGVPARRKVQEGMDATVASALSGLRIDDVVPAKDAAPPQPANKARYATFDGVVVNVTAWTKDGKDYVQFGSELDHDAASRQIAEEQARAKRAYEAELAASEKSAGNAASTTAAADAASRPVAGSQAGRDKTPPKPLAVSDPAADRQARLDALAKEVDALNRSFRGWTFVVPHYVYTNMTKTMDDMLAPLEKKAAAGSSDSATQKAKGASSRDASTAAHSHAD